MRYSEAQHPKSYTAAHFAVVAYEHLFHDFEVVGTDNLPKLGPVVLGASHRDGHDGVSLGAAANRPVFIMAKEEMWTQEYDFSIPLIGKKINAGELAGYFGAFPINRGNPQPSSLKHPHRLLRDAKVVGIFPEKTRYTDETTKTVRGLKLGQLEEGVGALALSNNAALIPVGIGVEYEINRKGKQRINKIAVVMNEDVRPAVETGLPRKLAQVALMEVFRESLQAAHEHAARLAA